MDDFTPYNVESEKIKRQRVLAELLRKQGMESPEGQMIRTGGGSPGIGELPNIYVAPVLSQHLAGLADVYNANKMQGQADTDESAQLQQAQEEYDRLTKDLYGSQTPALPQAMGQIGAPQAPPPGTEAPDLRAQPGMEPNTPEAYSTPLPSAPSSPLANAVAASNGGVAPTLPASPSEAVGGSESIWAAPEPTEVDPYAENNRRMGVASKLLQNPLGKALGAELIKKGVAFPEELAKQKEAEQARKDLRAQMDEAQLSRLQLQLASVDKNSEEGRALRREEMILKERIEKYKTDNKSAPRPRLQLVKADDGSYKLADLDKLAAGAPDAFVNTKMISPPSSEEAKKIAETRGLENKIDDAIDLLEKNPDAMGWAKGTAGSYAFSSSILNSLDPQGIATRAAVANIGSQVIKERSGATVTMWESPRLRPFIPFPEDSAGVAAEKLRGLRKTMRQEGYAFVRPAEKEAGTQEDINPLTADEQQELAALKAKHGR